MRGPITVRTQFKDTRDEGNGREMPVLRLRETNSRHATVGLIPQEGSRQNRGAELFCRNLKREVEEEREKDTRSPERRGPGECANGRGKGRGEAGWKSNGITEAGGRWFGGGDKFLR